MPSAFVPPATSFRENLFRADDFALQRAFFARRPELTPTPLHRCSALARHLGIGEMLVKDETARFGLNAFKATGALFAVATLRERGVLHRGDTLVCASEGNHGRAVARAARDGGYACRVYMSNSVAAPRVQAIEGEGAHVVLVSGNYDEAVRVMARDAEGQGWTIVSDTSWPGYTDIPRLIMLGYTRIMDEIDGEVRLEPRDVIFVPAGVGGLLASVACWCDWRHGPNSPQVVAVEPASAACVQASVREGQPTAVPGPFETVMGGLRCGEMSPMVLPAVRALVAGYVAIEDAFVFEAMRLLARPAPPDPPVRSGASGAAALGGLLATLVTDACSELKQRMGLGVDSRITVLVSEGVTDPAVFAEALARP
jgi:diaminopropionate ammonia-lyase